jgi:hypothetical protein
MRFGSLTLIDRIEKKVNILGMIKLVDQIFFLTEIEARKCEMSMNYAF